MDHVTDFIKNIFTRGAEQQPAVTRQEVSPVVRVDAVLTGMELKKTHDWLQGARKTVPTLNHVTSPGFGFTFELREEHLGKLEAYAKQFDEQNPSCLNGRYNGCRIAVCKADNDDTPDQGGPDVSAA